MGAGRARDCAALALGRSPVACERPVAAGPARCHPARQRLGGVPGAAGLVGESAGLRGLSRRRVRVMEPSRTLTVVLGKQAFERIVILHERRLDDDEAEVLLDADIAFKQAFNDALIVTHAARDELQQVVVSAACQMAFHDFIHVLDRRDKLDEVLAAMIGKRDFSEDNLHVAQLLQLDLRAISDDISRLLKPLHADQARARREPDRVGQLDIRDAAFLLQLRKDAQIYAVKLAVAAHRQGVSRVGSSQIVIRSYHAATWGFTPPFTSSLASLTFASTFALTFRAARTSGSASTSSSVFSRRSNIRSNSASV